MEGLGDIAFKNTMDQLEFLYPNTHIPRNEMSFQKKMINGVLVE